MKKLRFDWDEKKAASNFNKHGVKFSESASVFIDENAIEFFDENHSSLESRFIMIGLSFRFRILLVSYTVTEGLEEDIIRINSSRKATRSEQKVYFEKSK